MAEPANLTDPDWDKLREDSRQELPEALATKGGLPEVLLPYQAQLLQTTAASPLTVCEKSRRIGMTWGVGADAVLTAGTRRSDGGMDVLYIGYNLDMAREFIDVCGMWARAFIPAASSVEEFLFKDQDKEGGEEKDIRAFRIAFSSGFEIVALTSKPRSLRGRQGYVIFDEAAFHDALEELLKAAMALLMWGGKVLVISTHDGTDNPFNLLVREVNSGERKGTVLRVTFDEAIDDGLYERIALVTGKPDTPEAKQEWIDNILGFYGEDADEELHCIPKAGTGVWLSAPLIEARMTAKAPVLRLELPSKFLEFEDKQKVELLRPTVAELSAIVADLDLDLHYAAGFDFARVADLTVLTLLSIDKALRRREAFSIEMRNVPGREQIALTSLALGATTAYDLQTMGLKMMPSLAIRERLLGAAFDATGMGWIVAEEMGRRLGLRENEDDSGLVWAIKFSEDWYRIHMPPLKKAFEDDAIAIGADAEHLVDLRLIREIRGVPRVPPVRTGEKGLKRHGDYGIGLALAHFASRMRFVEYAYRGVARGETAPQDPGRMRDHPEDRRPARDPFRSPLGARLRGSV